MSNGLGGEFAGYSLVWSDEFDGAAGSPPDRRFWAPETGGHGWGNQELQYYTDSTGNAALDGAGHLAIVVRQADPQAGGRHPDGGHRDGGHRDGHHPEGGRAYTSARLVSKDRMPVRYGLVQARIKIPVARGIWPAFWMLGQDFDRTGWPGCGEIDVMEYFGTGRRAVQGAVHGPGYSGALGIAASRRMGSSLGQDFCVYSLSWEPGRIRWYVNGRHYHTVTPADLRGKPWVFDHDFFLLVNAAVGGIASQPPDRSTRFPQTMLIDYIRYYAPPGAPAGG